ncbi:hypothetical protein LSTR_LSTR000737 [Laodelphax striatellus]|uniref:Peroxisomal multifunctional enzyme type 2 n=1 Tax=Laodelphax striatellus TaxID=195883 RepID=A0A482XFH2_LAOST|nr:hypothetical protein LSTR_LSTR000737 [Laodelphax striatellus]
MLFPSICILRLASKFPNLYLVIPGIVRRRTSSTMVANLKFDDRVLVVTGAGAGLGRAYALLFAERGASVVVNDLGGSRDGAGKSSNAADVVVNEIKSKGGKAVADYNSVVDGDKIIQTALENFGRVDVVVNNAGILRDKSFARISDTDWNLIFDVHVKGSFKTTQAAWPHFKKQNFGRIIMTSSAAGLYGNFGQANYSAAKMALVGLSNTLAIEGAKNNIHCNVIVPTAASRLTEDILPPDFFAELKPELIAPVVVWLCHESCDENGSIIDSAVGWASKCQIVRSKGSIIRHSITDRVTPEAVQNNWRVITDMDKASNPGSIQEATAGLMEHLETMKRNADPNTPKNAVSMTTNINNKLIFVCLFTVGASVRNSDDLRFLYEGHEDFSPLPTFAVIPGMVGIMNSDVITSAIPGKTVELSRILHGEQYVELYKPIPASGELNSVIHVADVMDKGKGAVILCNVETFDERGEKVAFCQTSAFAVGCGGFGGKRTSDKSIPTFDAPNRQPDAVAIAKTNADQAAINRLSGDFNPLHIDPQFAAIGGYSQPILHGLCSLGFSVRHVLAQYGENDIANFKSLKARFSKPVTPGETLKTAMWREGNRVHFQTSVVESGNVVLSGAYVDFHKIVPSDIVQKLLSSSELQSEAIFSAMSEQVEANLDKVKKINGVFLYVITKNGKEAGKWRKVYKGDPESGVKADTTLTCDDDVMVDIATSKLNPQVAFMKGKLKIKGNIMLTQKLKDLMNAQSKL